MTILMNTIQYYIYKSLLVKLINYIYIYISAVKRLNASKIKVLVDIIYVFKNTHIHVYISEKYVIVIY